MKMIFLYLLSIHAYAQSDKEMVVIKGYLATDSGKRFKRESVKRIKNISPIILPLGAIGVTGEIKYKINKRQRFIYDIEDETLKYRIRFDF